MRTRYLTRRPSHSHGRSDNLDQNAARHRIQSSVHSRCVGWVRGINSDTKRATIRAAAEERGSPLGIRSANAAVNGRGDVLKQETGVDACIEVLGQNEKAAVCVKRLLATVRRVGGVHGEQPARSCLATVRAHVRRHVLDVSDTDVLWSVVGHGVAPEVGRLAVLTHLWLEGEN